MSIFRPRSISVNDCLVEGRFGMCCPDFCSVTLFKGSREDSDTLEDGEAV